MSDFVLHDSESLLSKIQIVRPTIRPSYQGFLNSSIDIARLSQAVEEVNRGCTSTTKIEMIQEGNTQERKRLDFSWMPNQQNESQTIIDDNVRIKDEEQKQKPRKNKSLNETKNIPKNFGKAIVTFIYKHRSEFCDKLGASYAQFDKMVVLLKERKKKINTIADLRSLWSQFPYASWVRILSNIFLRKYGVRYVYCSRITSNMVHIKYRNRLIEALKNPHAFKHIKEF